MKTKRAIGYLCAIGLLMTMGCSDDDQDDDLARLSGQVYNIDSGEAAEGVVVSLLGAEAQYFSDPTGRDGQFLLEVPLGSQAFLVANDFAGLDADTLNGFRPVTNDWLTLINVDPLFLRVGGDAEIAVHACPTPGSPRTWGNGAPGLGSAAVWVNFLENSETAPNYTDATDLSGKIITFVHLGTPANEDLGTPIPQITGISIDLDDPSFGQIGYWSAFDVFNFEVPEFEGIPIQDAVVGPDMFVEGGSASGPGVSVAVVFGNTGYVPETINATFTDTRVERGIDFSEVNPLSMPLRDGATTVVALGSVDNEVRTLREGLCSVSGCN